MKYLILLPAIFFGFANSSFGACNHDGMQGEINDCYQEDFQASDTEMNRLYTEKMQRLGAKNKQRLRDAQRAWIVFRDKSCVYEAAPASESGSMWGMDYYGCMAEHTKQRVNDLQSYIGCTENGCPE